MGKISTENIFPNINFKIEKLSQRYLMGRFDMGYNIGRYTDIYFFFFDEFSRWSVKENVQYEIRQVILKFFGFNF